MSGMQERAARAARQVRIGPLGPIALAAVNALGRIVLTGREADEIAAAVLAVAADVDGIADVIRAHQPTTGMSVASGVTCQCGYWNGVEFAGKTRPVGFSGLQWHQAEQIAAYIRGES